MGQKITVVNTATQAVKTFQSEASTLGELKAEMANQGIDYTNMTFFESTNGVELTADNSVVPTATTAKGLAIMLTKPNKQISSGDSINRKGLYEYIKGNNIAEDIKKKFGKNFTMVSSADLLKFIENHQKSKASSTKEKSEAPIPAPANEPKKTSQCTCDDTMNKVIKAIQCIASNIGCTDEVAEILGIEDTDNDTFSASELKKMQAAALARRK